MDKTYNPHALEERWYRAWEQAGYFEPSGRGEPYCIMIPPPNVTGTLHMGHAFQDTLMDALIRYRRMRGFNTLWQPGTDHAGIATQMVVERQLNAEGQTRHALGREAFVERVWAWKQTSGATITRQLRRMGASVDWSRERFTMDAGLSNAVREVFVRLYDESLIYRGKRLVNWDPVLHTALSDLEVVAQEERGHLWHMRYPFADGSGHMSVATTRPETMLGDTAVAVHPDDARYQGLIGKQVSLPLTGRTIPVIADDYVDPAFGSGCVKITPAHDFNDYRVGARHDLAAINILTSQAHINDNAPPAYRGLERFEARRRIVAELEAQGLIDKIEDHTFTVPRGDRSGEVLEPFLTDQWFVKVAPLAGPAIEAVETGRLRFVPETWTKTYFEWMHNIQDWCISRQLWWGHRIPAWYDGDGNLYVAHSEDEVRRKYGLSAEVSLEQDDDVLDTWFSSALWPFSTLGWPETTPALATFYPGSVLVTGFDIIFFWVARMIMMGLKLMDDVPFREVYIHGLVRDSEGQKMSKSKGNVLDPIDLIDGIDLDALIAKRVAGLMQPHMATQIETLTRRAYPEGIAAYGTDALRFTFAALASRGRDIKFDLGRIEGYRNFCNKLWNAARYVLMNCSSPPPQPSAGKGEADPHNSPPSSLADRQNSPSPLADRQNSPPPLAGGGREGGDPKTATPPQPDHELAWADRWIVSRLQRTEREVREYLETYRFDLAAQALYDFTWHDYCDWYLELSKPILRLAEESVPSAVEGPLPDGKALKRETEGPLCNVAARQRGTRRTLVRVLEALTRLLHPFMPFITEEIWQQVAPLAGRHGETIQHQPYPEPDDERIDAQAEHELEWVKAVIMGVRRIRSEMDIAPRKRVAVLLQHGDTGDAQRLERHAGTIKTLAGIERMEWLDGTEPPQAATALVGGMTLLIPLAGLIDIDAELARVDKEINKLENNLRKSETKLDNTEFVKRAPAEVVEKERARVQEMHGSLKQLQAQAARIRGL